MESAERARALFLACAAVVSALAAIYVIFKG
jgi:hypothetical protein